MKNTTNYGKIIAITLSVVTSACAIAFVIYRLFRNLIEFCNTYEVPQDDDLDLCELEEEDYCDEEDEEIDVEEIEIGEDDAEEAEIEAE